MPTAHLDALSQAVWTTDPDGLVTYWNPASTSLLGWTAAEALGKHIRELILPEPTTGHPSRAFDGVLAGQPPWHGVQTVRDRDGGTFTCLVTGSALRDDQGLLAGAIGTATSVGQMLRPLLSRVREAVVVTDARGEVLYANPVVERVLGWTDADLTGTSLYELVHPQDRVEVERGLEESLRAPTSAPLVETRCRTTGEDWPWLEGLITNLVDDPDVRGLVWTFRDISARQAALRHMTHVALHDPLTGLDNRVLLANRLNQAITRRETRGALLFIDLDDFKSVNDDLGHKAGDTLLRTLAERLRRVVRPEDSYGRWAGDEFMVLNETVRSPAEAEALAQRVADAFAEPVEISGRIITVQSSIGVAMLDGVRDADQVIHLADEHMYRVKKKHRQTRPTKASQPPEPPGLET